MDNILIVSNIVLWVCVIGLAFLVIALARQIGVLYERVAPAGALMMNKVLQVGMTAPEIQVEDINSGSKVNIGKNADSQRSQLIFFLSPTCPVCKTLLPMLMSAKTSEAKWLDLVLASDGDKQTHQNFIREHRLSHTTYVLSELLGTQYGVAKLPYAVLLDSDGEIVSMGLINSREHLESLFESKERGVDSIQSYMKKNTALATEVR